MKSDLAAQLSRDVYQYLAHPTAQRVGRALDTISKVALLPVSLLDWGFEQSKEWLKDKITQRLESIPAECIAAPPLGIAVSAITHIAVAHDAPDIRDLYAELLLKTMDSRTRDSVHPAYMHLVEQLSPEEACVLVSLHEKGVDDLFNETSTPYAYSKTVTIEQQFIEHCKSIELEQSDRGALWLDNLLRLRLLSIAAYTDAEYVPEDEDRHQPRVDMTDTRSLSFTTFGKAFVLACAPPTRV